ncbi:SkfA peptide export ATP-binding protein SkfE [Oceanobacillus picturae]|uniref:SkfA peptide export ATP-binding protein SkfE n=1 Tax=Oceanobacillus picturae TaxID=171693 RepID=W9APF6_9BACI|nr:ABC transporter ATP-binding protein [Oceanobacillus picturae]RIU93406.1 ABC transporter ATP-binding protein [Oceanobacillus picturae]GAQ17877.1 SkfA peptide export ATP-binding protein SkfE [Oceanobacillus picturae]CDO04777.1 SkfA peptide export ATP-binding protein SkfE [Oceanobacillus picturae]
MEQIVKFNHVTKKYKNITAINDLSFSIDSNDIVGLLGPNGAGKTTIIKLIATLTYPTNGEIYINGKVNKKKNPIISCIMEGNRSLYWKLTVKENIEFLLTLKGTDYKAKREKIEELLQEFNLISKVNELVQNLSRGMQQKLSILIALLEDSQIILLDEPTLGLDVSTLRDLEVLLPKIPSKMNKSLLITSHDMRFVEKVCNKIMVIQKGQLITEKDTDEFKNIIDTKSGTIKVKDFGGLDKELNEHKLSYEYEKETINISFESLSQFMDVLNICKDRGEIIEFNYGQLKFEDLFLEMIK